MPEVLRHASQSLELITGGRYVRVQSRESRELKRSSLPDERVLDAGLLSRGTQEQLYLSIRLGLAESFAEQSVALPLIMDDVLVNADPERAELLADTLAHTCHQHQIIYLTCHPHTTKFLGDRVPSCAYLQLDRLPAAGFEDDTLVSTALLNGGGSATGGVADKSSGGNDEVAEAIAVVLKQAYPEALGRSDLCVRAGVPSSRFTQAVNALLDAGRIKRVGTGRGTKYISA